MIGNYLNKMENIMDMVVMKEKTNANNIANYNTPNYKTMKVNFNSLLNENKNFMKTTDEKHFTHLIGGMEGVHVEQDLSTKERFDGNNVDLSVEMVNTIKNNATHTETVKAINTEFTLQKTAIGI